MKKLLIVLLIINLSSCSKEKFEIDIINCLDTPNVLEPNEVIFGNWCKCIDYDDTKLTENSKEFFPQFCLNLDDKISYKNSFEEEKNMVISSKSFFKGMQWSRSDFSCEDDATRNIGICFKKETAALNLKEENGSLQLNLRLSTNPERSSLDGQIGDFFFIWRLINTERYTEEFVYMTDKRSFSDQHSFNERVENFDSIILNEKSFQNVISVKEHSTSYKYYYNSEIGLIGFIDLNKELWVIQE